MNQNFYSGIFDQLNTNREKIFLKWPEKKKISAYNGKQISKKVSDIQALLENENIAKGDTVLLATPFSFKFLTTLLGVMAHGAIPIVPSASAKKYSILKIIFRLKVKLIFLERPNRFVKVLSSTFGIKIISASNFSNRKILPPRDVSENQTALISYSSGSTGNPAAIARTHKILKAQHLALKKSFPPIEDQRDFPLFPNVLLHNLSLGICTVIPQISEYDVRQMEPQKLVEQINTNKIHSLTGNVFYFKKLLQYLKFHNIKIISVKDLGIGGSPVPEHVAQDLETYFPNSKIHIIYGCTQAEPIAIRTFTGEREDSVRGYFVGKLHPDVEIKFDAEQEVRIYNKIYLAGMIVVRGPHVLTENECGWFKTGDFGYFREDGGLVLIGRQGNEAVIQGFAHYQIEHYLRNEPGLTQVAAIAKENVFDIYAETDLDVDVIRNQLILKFPQSIIGSIFKIKEMPMDKRHYSKVLYKDLCTQNLKT